MAQEKAKPQAHSQEDGDLDEKIAKVLSDDGEPEGEAETQEADERTPDNAGESESSEGSEEAAQADPDEDISDLLDEEKQLDLERVKKLAKSYKHAQKLVGETSKERERLKKLPQLEKDASAAQVIRQYAANDPEFAEAIRQADARARGIKTPAKQPERRSESEKTPEEIEKELKEAMAKGDYRTFARLAPELNPDFREFRETKQKLAQAEERSRRQAMEAQIAAEKAEFEAKFEGVLFGPKQPGKHREVLDQELYDAFSNEVNDNLTFEQAFYVAAGKLGRLPERKKPKADPAKAQAMQAGRGVKNSPVVTSEKDDGEWEGFTKKSFRAHLNEV